MKMVRQAHHDREIGSLKVNGHSIPLSRLDKIWFPKSKITKGDIIKHYYNVAEYLVPHVKNHPMTMQRCPEGITGQMFYQKNAGSYFPSWIKTTPIKKEEGGIVHYVVCNNAATLVYLATQGAITVHSWLSRYDKLQYPDHMIFDLDPSTHDFNTIRKTALLIKDILDELKVPSFAMITGSRGMHVCVPLKRVHTFDQIGAFALAIAHKMIEQDPRTLTLEVRKEKRGKKIFIDTLRNRYNATSVVPYAVRLHEGAPVATPLFWHEVHNPKLKSQEYTVKTIMQRLKHEGDPWKDMNEHAVSLKRIYKKVVG